MKLLLASSLRASLIEVILQKSNCYKSLVIFQNPYGNLSKCTIEAIEKMEKSGQQHQEESDQVADQIASDFCTWLRALPKGETENINYTSPDYIRQLFDERVRSNQIHQEYHCWRYYLEKFCLSSIK